MLSKIILIGGGGHCHACIDVIESTQQYEILGILDTKDKAHQKVLGYNIIGDDDDIPNLISDEVSFLITVGHIKSPKIRKKIFDNLLKNNAKIATVISPLAYVSKHSQIGTGTIIMHRAIVGPNVEIGENTIINTSADIEHDSKVGSHCHISTHSVINGNCIIGDDVFVGSNSTLFQGVQVVDNVVISAGSIVRKNIKKEGVYLNNQFIANV